ncbi:hypothetical protein [Flagellimonas halotolerans]|uniref:Uncharacterized protein n=1 Tax=Flagellimonas halotolerans TaxID=3112164 RepID=A0ABU6IN54_9FLAO|nr:MULTISPECIES: hypothetical protein [unclassified Allomuricauda]MEC3964597.1 hypothetical protein [Muricauda sp. SYSU M86414]MEC4264466.1 hypothetical protein [Muricauda sp. SYSU M84420]
MLNNELPAYLQSIFYPLFQHTKDVDCQLMLLDEMLEVGDRKEIPFLSELESHENPKISNKAFQIKNELQSKLGVMSDTERRRLPMNLCFIYDEFNIRPSKVDKDLDFEVELDILNTK